MIEPRVVTWPCDARDEIRQKVQQASISARAFLDPATDGMKPFQRRRACPELRDKPRLETLPVV
jgi:hypothetical protein